MAVKQALIDVAKPTIPLRPIPATAPANGADDVALYEVRKKIHPRAVHGWFAAWRVALIIGTQVIFYGLPWLTWNGRQAVLFDLGARKFYIFGLVFWPQDVIYLAVLLILSALSLFLFTAIAGRLWCGYACPQTVYTEIFMWIERKIEGDRLKRIRLDAAPMSLEKFVIKALKHTAWITLSVWTGYTFVGYFTPIHDLGVRAILWQLGPWESFWIAFYAFATYGNAGWMREQVCKYMCPYARFQSVMFDRDTLVIAYHTMRGEPRGARSKKLDHQAAGLGDCIDCEICVQVCPTGIDIRKGLQYECIGCAACIDGCDQVMDKMGYPRGLIRYASENGLEHGYDRRTMWKRVLRPRTWIYGGLLVAIAGIAAAGVILKNPLKVDIIRDRGALAREAAPGIVENVYRVQIMNTDERARQFTITAEGLAGLQVVGVEQPIAVEGGATRLIPLRLQVPAEAAEEGSRSDRPDARSRHIEFVIQAAGDTSISRREKSTFIFPR